MEIYLKMMALTYKFRNTFDKKDIIPSHSHMLTQENNIPQVTLYSPPREKSIKKQNNYKTR